MRTMRAGRTGGAGKASTRRRAAVGGTDGEQPREVQAADAEETWGGVVVVMEAGETNFPKQNGESEKPRGRDDDSVSWWTRDSASPACLTAGHVNRLPQPRVRVLPFILSPSSDVS